MSVKVAAEKNFRRAKVKPVKKRSATTRWLSWRLATTLAVSLLSAYALYRATNLVLTASALQVRHVRVHGNVRLSSGEVQALVDGLRGSNILSANLDTYRNRLRGSSNWVADVAIRRVLPSTVDVFVAERTPIGVTRSGARLYLVDRAGVLIDEFGPRYAEFDFPMIDGLAQPSDDGPAIDVRRVGLAARFLDDVAATDPELAEQVSQLDVNDARNVVVMLDGDTTLLHVGTEKFTERLQAYIDLAPTLRASVPEIDYVELRFAPRIYVQPVRGSRVVAARPLSAGN